MAKRKSKKARIKRTRRAAAKRKVPRKAHVPDEQWEMPAGYTIDGSRMASLKEIAECRDNSMQSCSMIQDEQRRELVARRIASQPKFNICMVGFGELDRETAIAEVRKPHSRAGQILIEIEQRLIDSLIERAKRKQLK